MADFTYKANNGVLENRYVTYSELGLTPPPYTPGILYAWGDNGIGQLGDGTITSSSSPVQIGALTNWYQVSGGTSHSLAVKTDGTLWAWGFNGSGQLGDGTTTSRSSPIQIGALTNWSQVSGGSTYSLAVKTDGTLWAWGNNGSGQLGDGTTTRKSSPVQIGALTNWSQVSGGGIIFGNGHSLAIKIDGTLWAWGTNNFGEQGTGLPFSSSPVQIGALTNWSQISAGPGFSLAIKTDGTLWAWGINADGNLGLNDRTSRNSPVQVGSLSDWKGIAASGAGGVGQEHTIAIKTNGTLWAWGTNADGQLGLGDITHRSSPIQIGALTNWSSIAKSHGDHSLAIKTDGTLWSWGRNDDGRLGDGTTTHRSSPVQIGTLTNWSQVYGGGFHSLALT
jgi:alpha-tubulin suppressor-like RCC1 family protein